MPDARGRRPRRRRRAAAGRAVAGWCAVHVRLAHRRREDDLAVHREAARTVAEPALVTRPVHRFGSVFTRRLRARWDA